MIINIFPTPAKLLFFICILILQEFFKKIEFTSSLYITDMVDEICVFLMAIFLFFYFTKKKELPHIFIPLSIFYGAYVFIGVVSSAFGEVLIGQAIFQFVLDLKFLIAILFCIASYRENTSETYFEIFLYSLLFLNVPFVLWQLLFNDSYNSFFSTGGHTAMLYLADGSELLRTAGLFWFTGTLANFSSFVAGYIFLKKQFKKEKNKIDLTAFVVAVVVTITTMSKGESFAAVISVFLAIILLNKSFSMKFTYFTLFSIIAVSFVFVFNDLFIKIIQEVGLAELGTQAAPRAIMMQASLDISSNNFPLGAGLGALGGQAAVVYDSNYFYQYLISHEWYFSERMFLTDTYWPKIFAESGLLSVIPLLLFILTPIRYSMLCKNNNAIPIFSVCMIFIMSLSAPVFNSPFIVCFMYFVIGSVCFSKTENIKIRTNNFTGVRGSL